MPVDPTLWLTQVTAVYSSLNSAFANPRPSIDVWAPDAPIATAAISADAVQLRGAATDLTTAHSDALATLDSDRRPAVQLWSAAVGEVVDIPPLDPETLAELASQGVDPPDLRWETISASFAESAAAASEFYDARAAEHITALVGASIANIAADLMTTGEGGIVDVAAMSADLGSAETALRNAWHSADHAAVQGAAKLLTGLAAAGMVSVASYARALDPGTDDALAAGILLRRLVDAQAVAAWSTWLAGWPAGTPPVAEWEAAAWPEAPENATEAAIADLANGKVTSPSRVAVVGVVKDFEPDGDSLVIRITDGQNELVTVDLSGSLRVAGLVTGARCRLVGDWDGSALTIATEIDEQWGTWPLHTQIYAATPARHGASWAWCAGASGTAAPLVNGLWYFET